MINLETAGNDALLAIIASKLSLRSHGRNPAVPLHTWLVHRQLTRSPGLAGYSLDARLVGKTVPDRLSVEDRSQSRRVRPLRPAQDRQGAIRPAMLPSTFVM